MHVGYPVIEIARWGLLYLLASVLLGGCVTVGPDFETPESDVAEEWLEAEDQRISSVPGDYDAWWKSFNDPILSSLIQQAAEQNKTLQIAGLRVFEARAILGIAAGSMYPQVQQAGGSVGRVEISENADPVSNLPDPIGQAVDTSFGNYRLGFDAAWELDFWGRFSRTVESADANLAATVATYDDVLVTLTGEVAGAYVLLRTLEERLAVAESNVAIQQRSLEISETRNRNQLTTELDPQIARAFLRDTQALVPPLKAAIRQVKNALCLLLGKPPGALDVELAGTAVIPVPPTEVTVGIPAELLRRRPDIRRAEARAASQSARIGIATAEMYPAFSLLGNVGLAANKGSDLFDSDSLRGFGVVGFRWNILNYGRIRNLVRVEDARFQQTIENYQNTVLKAAREVEDATASFIAAQEQAVFLEDGAKASQRAVDLSLVQYRDGTADYTRVLDAQRFLLLQQNGLTQARGKVAGSVVALYKALGGGWEQRSLDSLVSDETKDAMRERTNWGGLLEADEVEPVPAEERGGWRAPDR
jgi:NodT family efflux transporter outer membrane factor (OMF) lipoprotein